MNWTLPSCTLQHAFISLFLNKTENVEWSSASMEAELEMIKKSHLYVLIFSKIIIRGISTSVSIFMTKYIKMSTIHTRKKIFALLVQALFIVKVHDLFCTTRISRYFILKFYTHTHNILVYLYNFFQIFLGWKTKFDCKKKIGLHEGQAPKHPF